MVTFKTVEIVVAPEVPVTVIAAVPAGVPGTHEQDMGAIEPQPPIASASANVARHAQGTSRHRGARRQNNVAAAKSEARSVVS